ncbi:hydroxymethylbilane synthase [Hyphobacterium sp.]|uniref:hydroxymethylbilane synthase n=1 Tax=Hyphobacterium sp. TaxID=2004662 RepID=UPI003BA8F097
MDQRNVTLRLPLPIATRKSPLALAQAYHVQTLMMAAHELAEADLPILSMVSTGDKLTDRTLLEAGGKGLFTKEIDEALLNKDARLAVHSMKDVPTELPPGLTLAAILEREDPRDVLLTASGSAQLADLPQGATLGTASLRRQAQSLAQRPDLNVVTLRGNVDTRLGKLASGEIDATFLARAGLRRLGREQAKLAPCETYSMLPAVGQGAIGVMIREDDEEAAKAIAAINHAASQIAVTAERAFLRALDGSCRTPLAAHATIKDGQLSIRGEALTPDGKHRWAGRQEGSIDDAYETGLTLGVQIRSDAGDLLEQVIAAS